MRVIRTEMYFDKAAINRGSVLTEASEYPGVSFAFFRPQDVRDDLIPQRTFGVLFDIRPEDTIAVDRVLDGALAGAALPNELSIGNRSIIEYIKTQDIVLERSPPFGIPFSALLKGASAVSIGTLVGVGAANGFPMLFITVPAGILVVSSTVAVSRVLEKGIAEWLGQVFTGKKTKPAKRIKKG